MFQKIVLVLILLFTTPNTYSQDSVFYKNKIDSILISRSKSPVKRIKVKTDNYRVRYFFIKNSRELGLIEVIEESEKIYFIYNYHFIDGRLVMLSKYVNHVFGKKLKEMTFYYFKDGIAIFRDEKNEQISDLGYQIKRAESLKLNAPPY